MADLAGQRVVITGASTGLGAGIARVFGRTGAELILMDREEPDWDVACVKATFIKVDLADAEDTEAAVNQLDGPIDTLIHNAAILRPEPIEDVSLKTFRATLDVGIQAAFQLSQAVWLGMKGQGGGALIFVSSQSGIKGFVDETAYCAAKHALEGLSKCLAMEGEAHGIISCTVTPGKPMHTPMSERNYPPELKADWIAPDLLAPAFAHIARSRDPALSGQRLNAWDLSQEHPL